MEQLLGVMHEADVGGLRPTAYVRQHQQKKEEKV
jgi:hypothetical protein